MLICYVDDSGRDDIRTFTGLLAPASEWPNLLGCWLEARAELTRRWGVKKHVEIHANKFTRASGNYCETDEQNRRFRNREVREEAVDILLTALAGCGPLQVTTVASKTAVAPLVYRSFIDHLGELARQQDTQIMVVLDAQEGPIDSAALTQEEIAAARDSMYRNAKPYRDVHRDLDLADRRVLEDPVLHNSAFSQPIQAADLVAFTAYQHLWDQGHWRSIPGREEPKDALVKSYSLLSARWVPTPEHWETGSGSGVRWM